MGCKRESWWIGGGGGEGLGIRLMNGEWFVGRGSGPSFRIPAKAAFAEARESSAAEGQASISL